MHEWCFQIYTIHRADLQSLAGNQFALQKDRNMLHCCQMKDPFACQMYLVNNSISDCEQTIEIYTKKKSQEVKKKSRRFSFSRASLIR